MSFLERISIEKQAEVERLLAAPWPDTTTAPTPRSLAKALQASQFGAIAEIKRCSPSQGPIRPDADPAEIATGYAAAGAAALSVLTDAPHFGGHISDLKTVRDCVDIPVLRKDFLLHPVQLHEARAAGADAVLLIVAMLSIETLTDLASEAASLGMDSLVEVHTPHELAVALEIEAPIIGVNSRDLKTMDIDLARAESLLSDIPDHVVRVAESGIHTPAHRDRMKDAGAHAMLVGTSLMKASHPGQALKALLCG
ncbi:MAG: indole-3-glycerol phosphate synthase TrpC [Myxococcota bacterium]|nr:indole-3-glycerol phosphate synthase TrpC [Myxococcota bacterium]